MFTLNCKGRLLKIDRPLVMGILNITPDSFFAASRQQQLDDILRKAEQMIAEGATILDLGAQSTRPGSEMVGATTELQRLVAPIEAIKKRFPDVFISVDTFYGQVAQETVAAGADIINDISAGTLDAELINVLPSLNVPYVLMHMQGTPHTMQDNPQYKDVTSEVMDFILAKKNALEKNGVKDIIIDLGFGFGKTIEHNYTLLKNMKQFEILNAPILLGISRKSMITKTLEITAADALNGTTVLNTLGLVNGALILRVHDVKAAMECVKLYGYFES